MATLCGLVTGRGQKGACGAPEMFNIFIWCWVHGCVYCVKSHWAVPLTLCALLYVSYVSIKSKRGKKEKITMCHSWNLSIMLRRWVLWFPLFKKLGFKFKWLPQVTWIARDRVRIQAPVFLIKKALLFQLQDKGFAIVISALDFFFPFLEYSEL